MGSPAAYVFWSFYNLNRRILAKNTLSEKMPKSAETSFWDTDAFGSGILQVLFCWVAVQRCCFQNQTSDLIIKGNRLVSRTNHTLCDVWCFALMHRNIFFAPLSKISTGVSRVHSKLPQRERRKTQFVFLSTTSTLFSSSCFSIVSNHTADVSNLL